MKCEHCGNNLSLEDKVCPYCGKENKLASRHNKDMAKFKKDYDSVKNEVLENSRKFNGFTVRITAVAVLIALIAIMIICLGNDHNIRMAREVKLIRAHKAEFLEDINKFIDDRDYLSLHYYFQVNRLVYSAEFDDFYIAYTASSSYNQLLENLGYLIREDSYVSDEEAMEHIAGVMERLIEMREPESDYEKKKYYNNERSIAYVNDLISHSEILIRGYFGLSADDIRKFETLSKARKQVMLEEGRKNVR